MEQALVIGLGGINLVGVIVLGSMLRDANIVGQLNGTGLVQFAARILPWLQANTASFFAIPAFRWLLHQHRNNEIEDRNRARIGWAVAPQRANRELQDKLSSAREMAKQSFIGSDRIIYSTEKDFLDQSYEAVIGMSLRRANQERIELLLLGFSDSGLHLLLHCTC